MRTVAICGAFFLMMVLTSCKGRLEEHVTAVENGPFKILVRSQEFYHSAVVNIDVCIAETSSQKFPKRESCFLHGFDFEGLSVNWRSEREIEVSFRDGRVSFFRNFAFVYPNGPVPVEFHTVLCDRCRAGAPTTR